MNSIHKTIIFYQDAIVDLVGLRPAVHFLEKTIKKIDDTAERFFKPITRIGNPGLTRLSYFIFLTYGSYVFYSKYGNSLGLTKIVAPVFGKIRQWMTAPAKISRTIITFQPLNLSRNQISLHSPMEPVSNSAMSTFSSCPTLNTTLAPTLPFLEKITSTDKILPSLTTSPFSLLSQCPVETFEHANQCIPGSENAIESPISQGALQIYAPLKSIFPNLSSSNSAPLFSETTNCIPQGSTQVASTISEGIIQTISSVKNIFVNNATCPIVDSSIAETQNLSSSEVNTADNFSSYFTLANLGIVISIAALGYGFFKIYQYYHKQPNINPKDLSSDQKEIIQSISVEEESESNLILPLQEESTPPKISVEKPREDEKKLYALENLKTASQMLSKNSLFIKRYTLSTALFLKSSVYATVCSTMYLGLVLLSFPGIILPRGRSFFKKNFFQGILHLNILVASIAGTIFPYLGKKIFSLQMTKLYPFLSTKIG